MKLDWFTEETWTKGNSAVTVNGDPVPPDSILAEKFDIYGAIKISYLDDEEFLLALDKIRSSYKIMYKLKYAACVDPEKCYKKEGQLVFCQPTMGDLNDELDSFDQVKQLLAMSI